MTVKYIGKEDLVALEREKEYKVLSIEKGWYRIVTELEEDYLLLLPELFKIVSE